jgi:hypothetical protein
VVRDEQEQRLVDDFLVDLLQDPILRRRQSCFESGQERERFAIRSPWFRRDDW